MQTETLRAYLRARGWCGSELARRIGVSRQAVSLWLRQDGRASVRGEHLLRISEALNVPLEELLHPLPCLEEERGQLEAMLLWDRLYPDLVEFAIAVSRWEPKAVGRLVEVHGLYAAAKTLGPSVWNKFPSYAQFIHPTRRKELESLVRWRQSRAAS